MTEAVLLDEPNRGNESSYTLNLVLKQLRSSILLIAVVVGLMLLGTGANLVTPLLLRHLFDVAIPSENTALLIGLLVAMSLFPVIDVGLAALRNYFRTAIGEAVSRRLRTEMFSHVVHGRLDRIESVSVAKIVYAITRSCGKVGGVFVAVKVIPFFYNVLLVASTADVMLLLNWKLALVVLLAIPPSMVLTLVVARKTKKLESEMHGLVASAEVHLNEVFGGIRAVKAFNGESREEGRCRDWAGRFWRNQAKTVAFHDLVRVGLSEMVLNMVRGLIFGYGAFEVIHGRATVGDLVAFVAYVPGVYYAVRSTLDIHVDLETVRVSAERIDELMAMEREDEGRGKRRLSPAETGAAIEFSDVSFRYDREGFGLDNVSFAVQPNEFIGIVGPTGGGKSTILDLLLGFYEPQSGRVLIDEIDTRELSPASLRAQVSIVPQEVFLWNDTILANVTYPEAEPDTQSAQTALRDAQLEEFVSALPNGLAEMIGERGLNLAGGERQRIAIARAFYRQSRIVALDEATAALDALTEERLMGAIHALRGTRTLVVVAHRLRTIMEADNVLVVQGGRIVESGSPEELLRQAGLFSKLHAAQSLAVAGRHHLTDTTAPGHAA